MIGITGHRGVLGAIICEKLHDRNEIFSVFEGDIRDFDSLYNWLQFNDIDYVIHLASKVAVTDVENNLDEAYDVNVNGTITLIKALKKNNRPIGLFYASSSHVYASNENLIKETDAILPQNSYGLTKYVSELLLQDFSKSNSFLTLCIGRIFSFYHDTQKPPFLYPNLKKRFETEDLSAPFVLYGANSTRDFLPAEEVCSIIIKIVDKRAKGTFNIASGKPIKIVDFVKKIAPKDLIFKINLEEKTNHLNADITLLNSIIENE